MAETNPDFNPIIYTGHTNSNQTATEKTGKRSAENWANENWAGHTNKRPEASGKRPDADRSIELHTCSHTAVLIF